MFHTHEVLMVDNQKYDRSFPLARNPAGIQPYEICVSVR